MLDNYPVMTGDFDSHVETPSGWQGIVCEDGTPLQPDEYFCTGAI